MCPISVKSLQGKLGLCVYLRLVCVLEVFLWEHCFDSLLYFILRYFNSLKLFKFQHFLLQNQCICHWPWLTHKTNMHHIGSQFSCIWLPASLDPAWIFRGYTKYCQYFNCNGWPLNEVVRSTLPGSLYWPWPLFCFRCWALQLSPV